MRLLNKAVLIAPVLFATLSFAHTSADGSAINPTNIPLTSGAHVGHHKMLGDYTEQLALKLSDTLNQHNVRFIGVTSFVDFDSTLQHTHALGNQLGLNLMNDMQRFGFSTLEYKLMPLIKVSNQGDFALSRQSKELSEEVGIEHVLTGTVIYRQNGVLVNASVISTQTNVVKASARQFIPYFVLQEYQVAQR